MSLQDYKSGLCVVLGGDIGPLVLGCLGGGWADGGVVDPISHASDNELAACIDCHSQPLRTRQGLSSRSSDWFLFELATFI